MRTKATAAKLFCLDDPRSPNAEAYRTLRTNIRYARVSKDVKSLLVTSAIPGEGKTTTVANLAVAMAQSGKKVLLIDCDLRKPTLHKVFPVSNQIGLTNVLISEMNMSRATQTIHDIELDVITSGPIPPTPTEMLGSPEMAHVLEQCEQLYDTVLIDTPPLLPVTDALELAKRIEGVLLVLRSGKVLRESAKKAKKLLDHVGANVIGTVLNDKKVKKRESYYYYG